MNIMGTASCFPIVRPFSFVSYFLWYLGKHLRKEVRSCPKLLRITTATFSKIIYVGSTNWNNYLIIKLCYTLKTYGTIINIIMGTRRKFWSWALMEAYWTKMKESRPFFCGREERSRVFPRPCDFRATEGWKHVFGKRRESLWSESVRCWRTIRRKVFPRQTSAGFGLKPKIASKLISQLL